MKIFKEFLKSTSEQEKQEIRIAFIHELFGVIKVVIFVVVPLILK